MKISVFEYQGLPNMIVRRLILTIALLSLFACSSEPQMLAKCDASQNDRICGVSNPEDFNLLPSGKWMVFTEMMTDTFSEKPGFGSLSAYNVETGEKVSLFSTQVANWAVDELADLGDESCPGRPNPSQFGGHGIDVRVIDDGTVLLAVVNHGDREAIELFSVNEEGSYPVVTWRGCLNLDRSVLHNDVAIASDGSFYFTRFITNPHIGGLAVLSDRVRLMFGADTGYVRYWSKDGGVQKISNSGGSASNGISISADDKRLYVAEWGQERIYRLTLDGEQVVRDEIELGMAPDNFTWSPDGKLIITGQYGSTLDALACLNYAEATTCDVAYGVFAIDPITLSKTEIIKDVGAASVALIANKKMYVGSFAGDSIQIHQLQ